MGLEPRKLPSTLLLPENRAIYKDALWTYEVISDPERMEQIMEAMKECDSSSRSKRINYPLTPSEIKKRDEELNTPTLSLYEKSTKPRREEYGKEHPESEHYNYIRAYQDQKRISQKAREYRSSNNLLNKPDYEREEIRRSLPERDPRLLIVPQHY